MDHLSTVVIGRESVLLVYTEVYNGLPGTSRFRGDQLSVVWDSPSVFSLFSEIFV